MEDWTAEGCCEEWGGWVGGDGAGLSLSVDLGAEVGLMRLEEGPRGGPQAEILI